MNNTKIAPVILNNIKIAPVEKLMAAVTICSDFGAPKNKVWHYFHCFPISHEKMGPDAMIFVFWMLSFKPTFYLSYTILQKLRWPFWPT